MPFVSPLLWNGYILLPWTELFFSYHFSFWCVILCKYMLCGLSFQPFFNRDFCFLNLNVKYWLIHVFLSVKNDYQMFQWNLKFLPFMSSSLIHWERIFYMRKGTKSTFFLMWNTNFPSPISWLFFFFLSDLQYYLCQI